LLFGSACNPGGWRRESGSRIKGGALVRPGIVAIILIALAACSGSSATPPPSDPTAEAAILKKDCSDPHWRDENLGLWYSVCRQPLRW